ncbi:MAG: putative transcriptional regulator [Clostridia bacterium]|jgi:transcriptional regulator with XRE-family HTH domain|nr:putative transcriptional regulator [Clostridia bacterium]
MTLGEKIQQLRKSRSLSQEQLAEKLNISRQSISKWELNDATPDLSKIVMLSKLFSISMDELIKENVPLGPNKSESINCNIDRIKNFFKSRDAINPMIKDDLLDNYIGRFCSVDLIGWNDGVNNAYLTSYDNFFVYYVIVENHKFRIGALGKKYIEEIEAESLKSLEILGNYQTQAINKKFFITKKADLYLDDRYFWSGLIGEDTEHLNLTVRKFENEKIYVCQNANEFPLLISKISKLETIENK